MVPHLLLIEGDTQMREAVERGLGSRGFIVSSAQDGAAVGGPLTVDLATRRALLGTRDVSLSARELTLLAVFMRHPGQVLSRGQLLEMVWAPGFDPGSNVVDVYVAALRRKIDPGFIETVRGTGYRFVVTGNAVEGRAAS